MKILAEIARLFRGLWSDGSTANKPGPVRNPVLERRAALKEAGLEIDGVMLPPGSMGIAFSGGGIRSATISLGVAQALAREDQLLDFDYCSTVSGGGYFGSFLTSLFLPDWARGPTASLTPPFGANPARERLDRKRIAFDALQAKARSINLNNPGQVKIGVIRNPIWWLREHSRYLAPNGTSDYLIAAVYAVRNWAAMIYVMSLPIAFFALVAVGFDNWFLGKPGFVSDGVVETAKALVSPLWLIVLMLAFFALTSSAAFWSTEAMSNRADRSGSPGLIGGLLNRLVGPRLVMSLSSVMGFIIALALLRLVAPMAKWPALYSGFGSLTPLEKIAAFGCALMALSCLTGLMMVLITRGPFQRDALTAEVRRRITLLNALLVKVMMIAAAAAFIDTLGILGYGWWLEYKEAHGGIFSSLSAAILPAIAWIINKLQGSFKDRESLVKRLLGRSVWTIALIAGLVMFVVLAVGIHIAIQHLVFAGGKWSDLEFGQGSPFALMLIALSVLTVLTGSSTGFINLSSLHGIYASRLTRAYLGASNRERLKKAGNEDTKVETSIRDSEPLDQIPVDIYQQTVHLGPLHLINVTLNETRSPEGSQLLERDRKGVPLVFAPEGIFVNAARERNAYKNADAYTWSKLDQAGVEQLSVGQLCAISGAAASTAMGSQTTLGGALALSFANIRLGYWWDVKALFRHVPTLGQEPLLWLYQKVTRPFRTYFYLWNELIANYTRENARLNLSDGGHFDNSGAYELLRREVYAIVVCDNGADPDFRFGDLEVLIRKARIDLGLAIEVATPATVKAVMGVAAEPLFLNGDDRDWRARAAARCDRSGPSSPEDYAYCLLLNVFEGKNDEEPIGRILWIKPRLFAGLAQDVIGYALAHPDFPHETTGDQFFNEAQWESYRSLGFSMMSAVLRGATGRPQILRSLVTDRARLKKSAGGRSQTRARKPKSAPVDTTAAHVIE